MSLKEPQDPKPFTFEIRGHGHVVPAGTYQADSEEDAFKLALQKCKGFTLPGWTPLCKTTGNAQAVVAFIDDYIDDKPVKVRA